MKNKNNILYVLLFFTFLSFILIPSTISRYVTKENKKILLNVNVLQYKIIFHSNNGLDDVENQVFSYGEEKELRSNTFTKSGYNFKGWNSSLDGSGTRYYDEEKVLNLCDTDNCVIDLYAEWSQGVAEVNGVGYPTLQDAINAVSSDGVLTTVILLKDVSEYVIISNGQNIVLDIGNKTISNSLNNKPVIENRGSLSIINGTITSNATASGTINNTSTGVLSISGGSIINMGNRQAIYNDGGIVNISGDAYLKSVTDQRATVQSLTGSTLNITGGTIISDKLNAIQDSGTMTIGIKDGNIDNDMILIRGFKWGITSNGFNYYDGIIEGKTKAINNESSIKDTEEGYSAVHGEDIVDGVTYDKVHLDNAYTITFDTMSGSLADRIKNVKVGEAIGTLPTPRRVDYTFDGWWTMATGGEKINENIIIDSDVTYYAHWIVNTHDVAQVNGVNYDTLQLAINNAPSGVETTITLLKDAETSVNISETKNIIIDLDGNKLTSVSGDKALFENKGTLTIKNGVLTSSNDAATVNNNSGYMILDSVTINATGERQAVFVKEGTVEIIGDSYISSMTTGVSSNTYSTLERGTVQAIPGATLIIRSGTIECSSQHAVSNEGTLIIGEEDGVVSSIKPIIKGYKYGINSIGEINFYDGIIKGKDDSVFGTINNRESGTSIIDNIEIIDGEFYKTKHLE